MKTVEKKFDRLQLANSILLADSPAKESVREAKRINGTPPTRKETSVVREAAASEKPRKQASKSVSAGKGKPTKSTGKGGSKR